MATATNRNKHYGLLTAKDLIDWKTKNGVLKVPIAPSVVIISPQLKIVREKKRLLSKEIQGLSGMHLCIDVAKGIYLSSGWGIGAPALVAACEELHALGATTFYLAGVAGRLTDEIAEGDKVIARSAIREEGTSQHYLQPTAQHIIGCPGENQVDNLAKVLSAKTGLFVSTDAPYRETIEKCNDWRAQNAAIVDMETAALYAFGNYYNIKTYSIAVAADSLAGGKWEMAKNYTKVEQQLSMLIDNLLETVKQ